MRPELDDTVNAADDSAPRDAAATATAAGPARASAAPGLAPGQQLGHFRIERPLGAGGMGEVYLATDLALDRPVAIKVLPDDLAQHPTRRDRLIREARAQARVSHPNVGHIYFIGEEAGRLYFAMEFVAGTTVAERIATGPLSVDEALSVIHAAALGLREAQRSGFTHRDVKPSNLMFDSHGHVKVLDFGLAAGGSGTAGGPVNQTSLAGTPLYMAPEQGRGEAVDFRADIYALGATLYHLVSGKPPFSADTADELLSMHATAARPPLPRGKHARTRLAAIDTLCTRMMAPRPEDRFASYDELLRAIELVSAVHTRPAGFWVRGIATALDFGLIAILTALVIVVGEAVTNYELVGNVFLFPALALYQTLGIARWGTTLGKALFELEVVSVETQGRPSWRSSVIRAATMSVVPAIGFAASAALRVAEHESARDVAEAIGVLSMTILGLLLLVASARTPGKRAPWDRVAGTMVRYRTARHPAAPA